MLYYTQQMQKKVNHYKNDVQMYDRRIIELQRQREHLIAENKPTYAIDTALRQLEMHKQSADSQLKKLRSMGFR